MLANLPMVEIVSSFAIILLLIFFVTSSDSGSLVINTITAGGKLHAPVAQRIFWTSMEGLVAAVLPLLICVSLYKGLSHEWQRDSRLRSSDQS